MLTAAASSGHHQGAVGDPAWLVDDVGYGHWHTRDEIDAGFRAEGRQRVIGQHNAPAERLGGNSWHHAVTSSRFRSTISDPSLYPTTFNTFDAIGRHVLSL
jgi:hypothetical protein